MFEIENKGYGFKLTFGDYITKEEMGLWLVESRLKLKDAIRSFGIFVDMRTLKPLNADALMVMQEGQKLFKEHGMIRSVVIVANPITKMQFKRIAKETGIYSWERYIDEQTDPNWKENGLGWVKNGIDPDGKLLVSETA